MTMPETIRFRRSIRLHGYDYAQPGAYFITVCVQNRECLLGEVAHGKMSLNEAGLITGSSWEELPQRFSGINLDIFTVMPNHFHGIVLVAAQFIAPQFPTNTDMISGVMNHAPTLDMTSGMMRAATLGNIIRAFKAVSTRRIRRRANNNQFAWQRNYYEHIIRSERGLNRAREYIATNPLRWHLDRENPGRDESRPYVGQTGRDESRPYIELPWS